MIKQKSGGQLIIISGTTCAGKGTVIHELLKRNENLALSVSHTSRPIRLGDVEDVTYHFVSKSQFEEMIQNDEFLEYEKVHGDNYYGTSKKEIDRLLKSGKDVILEIEVNGAQNVKRMYPETILIFIMAPSMEVVKERIKARGAENSEQILERFQTAYREINEIPKYNYVVVNDIVENATKKIEAILVSEKCRVDRIEEIYVENQEEIVHEFLMDKDFDNTPFQIEEKNQ